MAELTVSDRQIGSHGSHTRETGSITPALWNASEWFVTKLGNILWLELQSVDGTADAEYIATKNYTSGLVAKNGHVLMTSGGQNATYRYEAIGRR